MVRCITVVYAAYHEAEPNDVIGASPAQLLFGNSIQLVDRGIFLPNLPKEGVEAKVILSDDV